MDHRFQFSLATAFVAMLVLSALVYVNVTFARDAKVLINTIVAALIGCYFAYRFQRRTQDGESEDLDPAYGELIWVVIIGMAVVLGLVYGV